MSSQTPAQIIHPQTKNLGEGFLIRRLLPAAARRTVGPFIFFDHFGPVYHKPGQGLDVRPHPHIGLSTVTYLFEGALRHQDMLGNDLVIRPGAVNWMTAGRGICHSERTPPDERRTGQTLHGIQTWVALPRAEAEADPDFKHHPAQPLPDFSLGGARMHLLAGKGFGRTSPVSFPWQIWYLAGTAQQDARFVIPGTEAKERCIYMATGQADIQGTRLAQNDMAIFTPGADIKLHLQKGARFMLAGGDPIDGTRKLDWNFVAETPERLVRARADWQASIDQNWRNAPFSLPPGETEFIPLPDKA